MRIPYRTQRTIRRVGIVFLIFLMLFIIAWFCSVVFLERHVVYTREGAMLDLVGAIAAAIADGSMDKFVAEAGEQASGKTGILVDGEIVIDG